MSKAIFLCVGSGGHVLPVVNIINTMVEKGIDKKNILIITDQRGKEYLKNRDYEILLYPFVSSKTGLIGYLLKIFKIFKSIFVIFRILKNYNPKFLFTTGAYIAPIAAIVSRLLKVDLYIQEQNIYSGLGNKIAAPFSKVAFTSFPDTQNILKNKVQYCGPVLNLDFANLKNANKGKLTIGFQGGSQGSDEINNIVYKFCKESKYSDINVIHIAGANNETSTFERKNYHSYGFLNDMQEFYNNIDIQVSRSGGGVLEAAYLNIPQILIPYKHGTTASHQRLNAEYLQKIKAAKIVETYEEFIIELDELIKNNNYKNLNDFRIKYGNEIISKRLVDELNK
tara:strand:- start:557 stop:1573 length:1017 start_codon:yes stop_codon:yes gene_type:complete